MPSGVYPNTHKHVKARGLSKNKYDTKGNLRKPRASRAKPEGTAKKIRSDKGKTHTMKDGAIHTGKTHTAKSKVVKPAPKARPPMPKKDAFMTALDSAIKTTQESHINKPPMPKRAPKPARPAKLPVGVKPKKIKFKITKANKARNEQQHKDRMRKRAVEEWKEMVLEATDPQATYEEYGMKGLNENFVKQLRSERREPTKEEMEWYDDDPKIHFQYTDDFYLDIGGIATKYRNKEVANDPNVEIVALDKTNFFDYNHQFDAKGHGWS